MLTYQEASDKVIIALDCSKERAFELADLLAGKATWVKVGMTLFYAEGPAIVDAMRERGLRVFLDLKVHDIPFQVQGAVRAASLTGADILSIHGLGGSAMIAAARKGAEEAAEKRGGERTRLVAISVLTSMDQAALAEIGVEALRYQCIISPLIPVNVIGNMSYQVLGRAAIGTFLASTRQGICFLPMILLLPPLLGIRGVELAQPAAETLAFFICGFFVVHFYREVRSLIADPGAQRTLPLHGSGKSN